MRESSVWTSRPERDTCNSPTDQSTSETSRTTGPTEKAGSDSDNSPTWETSITAACRATDFGGTERGKSTLDSGRPTRLTATEYISLLSATTEVPPHRLRPLQQVRQGRRGPRRLQQRRLLSRLVSQRSPPRSRRVSLEGRLFLQRRVRAGTARGKGLLDRP